VSTPFAIPLTDVAVPEQDVRAVLAALDRGWRANGPLTRDFEEAFAAWHGRPAAAAAAVSSGTASLHLALAALGIGPGDEVLVPAMTFVATAAAVRYVGATPVLCDAVSPERPLLDAADAAARVTARTRAVLPVHFGGYPADDVALRALCAEHGLLMVEDCAQAVGARLPGGGLAGTAGAAGCFSFFSKKQLCAGEGGAVLASDPAVAARVRELRESGVPQTFSDAHAALASSRLTRLAGAIDARRAAVRAYRERLAGLAGLTLPFSGADVELSSHFAFMVILPDRAARDAARAGLHARGIQTTWYPALTMFSEYAGGPRLPRATEFAQRHLVLPLSSSTTTERVDAVVTALREVLAPSS